MELNSRKERKKQNFFHQKADMTCPMMRTALYDNVQGIFLRKAQIEPLTINSSKYIIMVQNDKEQCYVTTI